MNVIDETKLAAAIVVSVMFVGGTMTLYYMWKIARLWAIANLPQDNFALLIIGAFFIGLFSSLALFTTRMIIGIRKYNG